MNIYDLLGIDLAALVADAAERKEQNHPYLAPSQEPLGWQTRGKLVTLDAAIMAVHLIAARVAFKGFAGLLAGIARTVKAKVEQSITDKATRELVESGSAAAKRVGFAVGILNKVKTIIQRSTLEAQKEGKIRLASIKHRRELYALALKPKFGGERKTKYVHTRHTTTPHQRKANKSWRSPRSRRKRK